VKPVYPQASNFFMGDFYENTKANNSRCGNYYYRVGGELFNLYGRADEWVGVRFYT
jgi:hypothetical protein